ncbi:MAG: hypothetical protein ACKOZZ_12200, partial [Bacteroidota bacterium]
ESLISSFGSNSFGKFHAYSSFFFGSSLYSNFSQEYHRFGIAYISLALHFTPWPMATIHNIWLQLKHTFSSGGGF